MIAFWQKSYRGYSRLLLWTPFFDVEQHFAFLRCGGHASGLPNMHICASSLVYLATEAWYAKQPGREGCPDAAGDLLRSWVISYLSPSSPPRISCTDHLGDLFPGSFPVAALVLQGLLFF